ncbi:MAG: DMT family protein [Victivallaceae bacterium]|nr:DMT family protein [Victivallaceae bacterium]
MEFLNNPALWKTAGLLVISNCFMTFAWYGHLRSMSTKPLICVILINWLIAFFEYCVMTPANRIGHAGGLKPAHLKIMQEVITLSVFVPFSVLFLKEQIRLNYLWAALCMCGAVYFVFKN